MTTPFIIGLSLGLLGGLHCITMCGPIAAFLHKNNSLKMSSVLYNGGRIITYILLGLSVGFLGEGLAIFGYQQIISIISGILVIFFVLIPQLSKWTSGFGTANKVIVLLRDKLLSITKTKSPFTYLGLGILNGALPCGLVYMALVSSFNTGDSLSAGILMAGFGLGTSPLMTVIMMGGMAFINKVKIKRLVPALTVAIGLFLIVRGMALDIPYISPLMADLGWDLGITTCR